MGNRTLLLLPIIAIVTFGCSESKPAVVFLGNPPSDEVFSKEKITDSKYVKSRLDAGLHPDTINDQTTNQDYLLTFAVRHHAIETVALLLESGAAVDVRSTGLHKTPLFQAAFEGDMEIVELLVEAGADVNATDDLGNNVLREAILAKRTGVVEHLLEAGCNPDHRNVDGKSMRDIAIQYGTEEIKSLMKR
jgi:ankyrin repeat protein